VQLEGGAQAVGDLRVEVVVLDAGGLSDVCDRGRTVSGVREVAAGLLGGAVDEPGLAPPVAGAVVATGPPPLAHPAGNPAPARTTVGIDTIRVRRYRGMRDPSSGSVRTSGVVALNLSSPDSLGRDPPYFSLGAIWRV
jgi:hypothetical protein